MKEDLSFVPTLGTLHERVPRDEEVASGTHTDCILRESLRPLDGYADAPTRLPDGPFVLATSFPEILPSAGQMLLSRADAVFTRGEFPALRVLGGKVASLPLRGEDEERFTHVVDQIAAAAPPVIYHRLMDYNPDEFDFLENGPGDHLRGSGRLLVDKALLDHELAVVERWQRAGKIVRVVLPYIASPDEQEAIHTEVKRAVDPDQIGVMVERVEHARHIGRYPPSDFLFPGPSDLTADFCNVQRGDYREGEASEDEIITLAQDLVRNSANAYVLAIKILVGKIQTDIPGHVKNVYMPNQLIARC